MLNSESQSDLHYIEDLRVRSISSPCHTAPRPPHHLIPLVIHEAIRQDQIKDRLEEHRAQRSNSIVSSSRNIKIHHRQVALRDNKVLSLFLLPSSFTPPLPPYSVA
jgi:hypothetical protein